MKFTIFRYLYTHLKFGSKENKVYVMLKMSANFTVKIYNIRITKCE
jgi:hypothetical protein